MKHKICMITGASDGIGKAAAIALARSGATLVLVCRNRDKGEDILNRLIDETSNKDHTLLLADLARLTDIRKMVSVFMEKFDHLDVLVNNAGIFTTKAEYTEDNIELQFAVNHIAGFLLSNLLMESISRSGAGRIINVSSISHRFGRINFADLFRKNNYEGLRVYEQSKLANVLFTYELARRLKNSTVTVNCMSPGRVSTNIGSKNATGVYKFLWNLNKPFLISPEKGAETIVYLATAEEVRNVTGAYFYKCRKIRSSKLSYNENVAKELWEASERLIDIKNLNVYQSQTS